MADLPSILGGMAQGFLDFGKSAVDLFGTGGASIADLIESARTGKVTTKNSDDFRKWLYETDDVKDAAAKGLGTALNGVQTVSDYIPGIGAVTRNPLFNAGQGALGGLADEFKMYGKDYDLGRAGQRAAVGAGGALASTGLADALKGSGNALLKSGTAQGLARGAVGGAIGAGGYTAIDGGSLGDVANSALQGAGMGAALGGTMGALQDFKPAKTYDVGLTDDERASRLKEVRKMRNAIGSEKAYMSGALDEASENRWSELYNLEQAYKNGFDNYNDYHDTLRPVKGIDDETLGQVLKNMKEPELQPWMQKGSHQPTFDPTMSSLASSMDRTVSGDSFMPDDFYQHMDWYGGGDTKPYLESASAIRKIRGNPNAKVTMYRATVGDTIYPNDWVTLSPEYAKQHLANALRDQPDAKIIKQTVAARDLRWPGDDINEFGYYPITNGDIARAKALDTTLADADMAVNNPQPKISRAAKAGDSLANTLSAGDRAINDYESLKHNGMITDDMRKRAADVIKMGESGIVPENELYNRIDPSTLPEGHYKTGKLLDEAYEKGADVNKITEKTINDEFTKKFGDNPDKDALIDYLFDFADNDMKKVAKSGSSTTKLSDMAKTKLREEYFGDGITALASGDKTVRNGYTGALDTVLSERLGIAPGNTYKKVGTYDDLDSLGLPASQGRTEGDVSNPGLNNIMVAPTEPSKYEEGISAMGHERLHSFQNEAKTNGGRYSDEVNDAYKELAKDLKKAGAYKNAQDIKAWWGEKVPYYRNRDEQEARMLQQYLFKKGYTGQPGKMSNKVYHNPSEFEFDDAKIAPAFDKFVDKLRDMSRRGIALPALTALFGGDALMTSQQKDKEEVK